MEKIILFLLIICSWNLKSQHIDCRHTSALLYLNSNDSLINAIEDVFKLEDAKRFKYRISNERFYPSFNLFKDELEKDIGSEKTKSIIESKDTYDESRLKKNYSLIDFNYFKNPDFKIFVSDIVYNKIMLECVPLNFDSRLKLGKSVKILFVFDKDEKIQKVYWKTIYNN